MLSLIHFIVKTATLGSQPNFVKRFLQVDDHLALVGKHQCHHAPNALIVDINNQIIVDAVTTGLDSQKNALCTIHKLVVSH